MIVHRDRHLSQLIEALRSPRCLAGRLHRRQEQRDKDTDNGNHHEQLDQRETM
jgi:hypothetical protein